MPRSSLLVHVVMIVMAGTIGYLYVFPTVVKIRENQDTAVVFNREVAQVSGVNSQLQQKLTAINNIPLENRQRLLTYMPDNLDDVAFLRTIESILISVGITPSSLQFGSDSKDGEDQNSSVDSSEETVATSNEKTIKSDLFVSFETDEVTLYNFFDAVQQSVVPFVLKEAVLTPGENGGVSAELIYVVHALASTNVSASTPDNTSAGPELEIMAETAF